MSMVSIENDVEYNTIRVDLATGIINTKGL
jgi:hypothetical protein